MGSFVIILATHMDHEVSVNSTDKIPAKAPTRRSRAVAAKRTAILTAALALFSQFGVHGTSLDKVAEGADV